MILTEKEAKTKWCPEVHKRITVVVHKDELLNKQAIETETDRDKCIASDCMMWRHDYTLNGDTGYCGLGGKP